VPRRTIVVRSGAAALTALALAACGTSDDRSDGASVATGDPSACPGGVTDVVVSVGQWGDIVERLGGDCTTVTTIVNSPSIDPHDFEPGTSELAAFSGADVVVLNGAHYDEWAENVLDTLDDPVVISAAEVAGVQDGEDPHLWYDPAVVEQVADAVTAELTAVNPSAEGYFANRAREWDTAMVEYHRAVDELRTVAAGRTYAASETVFDRMAAAVGLTDLTPEGYRRAVSNEGDPAPGDLAAFEALLAGGGVDVLIENTQTEGGLPEQLTDGAKAGGVALVPVTESQPRAGGSFIEWQVTQLRELAQALSATS
jgi:zinc/manganese transport system substrate-binding protein